MVENAYIHIPFCKSKCKYCSFVSYTRTDCIEEYINALLQEISMSYNGEELKTLYFGGGTPSLLKETYIQKIISKFKLHTDCEVTLELNPDDANIDYLKSLKDLGINRISIGSQSFDNNVLKNIGRRHNTAQTIRTFEIARNVGFKNISLDLIYGLPDANITEDINNILQLHPEHISTYGLKIEEGSYFYNHLPDNLPDDDAQADMYLEINEELRKAGYYRYEISNFSQKGFESAHNLNYWNNNEYYGFGVAAHGYLCGSRYSNKNSLDAYINNPIEHASEHIVTDRERMEEEIFLGFRKESGIDIQKFGKTFGINFEENYSEVLNKYCPEYIQKTDFGYKLTLQGVLLSNYILSEFI